MKVFSAEAEASVWGPIASIVPNISALGSEVNDSWLLEGLRIGAEEITDVRQCFNDIAYIYALGNNQSNCRITLMFVIMAGTRNCMGSDNFSTIDDGLGNYRDSRISTMTKSTITIGGMSRTGWLTGIDIGDLDPLTGVCHGVVNFIMEL